MDNVVEYTYIWNKQYVLTEIVKSTKSKELNYMSNIWKGKLRFKIEKYYVT